MSSADPAVETGQIVFVLELQGLPALDQSWAAFDAAVAANTVDGRADAGFPAVGIPVRLGNLSRIDDGLLGYFVDDWSTPWSPRRRWCGRGPP